LPKVPDRCRGRLLVSTVFDDAPGSQVRPYLADADQRKTEIERFPFYRCTWPAKGGRSSAEQTHRYGQALSAWPSLPRPMASQAGAWPWLSLRWPRFAIQPALGFQRRIWLYIGVDETTLRALVGMRNEAVFRQRASDPV